MTLGRVLFYLGIAVIVYSLLTGFSFHFSMHQGDINYTNAYTIKIGTLLFGVFLVYLGKKIEK